jgi:ketopantoate reductase
MTFWQRQKVNAAMKFLRWRLERQHQTIPDDSELKRQAEVLVEEAQRIAQRTGKNFISILKELVNDLRK